MPINRLKSCNITHVVKKMDALLKIVAPEAEPEIDHDKLKHMVSQKRIWDYFGLTAEKYSELPSADMVTMIKKYYLDNLQIYHGNGKSVLFFW